MEYISRTIEIPHLFTSKREKLIDSLFNDFDRHIYYEKVDKKKIRLFINSLDFKKFKAETLKLKRQVSEEKEKDILDEVLKSVTKLQKQNIKEEEKRFFAGNTNYPSKFLGKYELNRVYTGECVKRMKYIPNNSVDLIVTSPPYDELRDYKGNSSFDLHQVGIEVFRVLKEGGIAAMVIQDQTKNFGKSLTSFRTIIDWCDEIGFKLFETVIYRKNGSEGAWWTKRFRVDHEYMPIFLKGERPQFFNKEPLKIKSKHGGKVMKGSGSRKTNGETQETVTRAINSMKCRGTIWNYLMAGDKNPLKRKHPAVFPDKIPFDFIQCFCPENGIVLDPFTGSGSTLVMAQKLGRYFIGFDIEESYCDVANQRLVEENELKLF